tara:strand:- start:12368 stop:17842 length:5475 start_codon:yes stop_codon:yes gene_type:complete
MPAINPNNYNIDFFQTYSFGDLTDSDYVTYLLGQNLLNLPEELIDGAAGNFLSVWTNERGLEKTINYSQIENPGDVDEWMTEGNVPVNLNDIRTNIILKDNEYGPASLAYPKEFNCPELEVEETGFIQYPTSTGGNVVTNVLGETLDAVGLGGLNAFLIDFPSELNEVANERRLTELKNRVQQNLINETVGRINLDPIGLLAGQPLFGKDYKITKPAEGIPIPGLGILTDLTDFNLSALRKDPLPDGAFDWDQKPMDNPFSPYQIDISQTLLEHTGKGTQNLLYEALKINKYGPIIQGQNEPLGNEQKDPDDANQPSQKLGYLDHTYEKPIGSKEKSVEENKTKLAGVVDKIKNIGKRESEDLAPTEENNPTVKDSPIMTFQNKGFDFDGVFDMDFTILKGSWDFQHLAGWTNQYYPSQLTTDNTPYEDVGGTTDNVGPEPNARWNGDLFWKDGRDESTLPKRGLLRYTQKLINKSTGEKGRGSAAQFVGLPNSDQNYFMDGTDRRHITMSQGNLVKETKENKYYCRSWSVRNTYNRYNDLIRHDELWRDTQPGTIKKDGKSDPNVKLGQFSTLRSPGIPKIAWEKDGEIEKKIMALQGLTVDKSLVIPYMFSIENLAWKDAPHYRKLPQCEKGPFGGRIMWFPPYNISFTDNTSVNWDTTSFIGRAEPIYTYNNTERTGTLTFSIVVDHPSVINKIKDKAFKTTTINDLGEEETVSSTTNLETFFAGCDADTTKNIIREAFKEIIPAEEDKIPEPEFFEVKEVTFDVKEISDGLSFYFKNAEHSYWTDGHPYTHYNFISSNTGCPDPLGEATLGTNDPHDVSIYNIQGRCVDYNYEKDEYTSIDNPKLYKTGTYTLDGACWGAEPCEEEDTRNPLAYPLFLSQQDDLIPLGYNQEDLVEIPIGSTNIQGEEIAILKCGNEQNQSYGPNVALSDFTALWWTKEGQGYSGKEFCKQCLPKTGSTNPTLTCPAGYTLSGGSICYSGTTTASTITAPGEIINANLLGFKKSRPGYNQRFWGTGNSLDPPPPSVKYSKENLSPKLNLNVDVAGVFAVTKNGSGVAGAGISQLIEFLSTTPEGKVYRIHITGNASALGASTYNDALSEDRAQAVRAWMIEQMLLCEASHAGNGVFYEDQPSGQSIKLYKETKYDEPVGKGRPNERWSLDFFGETQSTGTGNNSTVEDTPQGSSPSGQFIPTPSRAHPADTENLCQLQSRRVDITLKPNPALLKQAQEDLQKENEQRIQGINEDLQKEFEAKKVAAKAKAEAEKQEALELAKNFINECDYFMQIKEEDSFLYDSLKDKLRNFHPAFHSITPEGFNSRITFLQQCGRQGPSFIDPNQPQNTAFGRPPVCILRIGDFYNTKIIIDTINFTFDPLQWDLNPEGIGVQPMICSVDLNFKFIGGSTLQGPLSALQNAVSYNFFANTALYMPLEKILTTRTDAGKILEIDESIPIADELKKTYFYGPFAGQGEFNDAIGLNKESEDVDTDEDNESEEAASQGEGGKDNEDSWENSPCNPKSEYDEKLSDVEAGDNTVVSWLCKDGTIIRSKKIPEIKSGIPELDDNTTSEDGTELGAPNTTDSQGRKIWVDNVHAGSEIKQYKNELSFGTLEYTTNAARDLVYASNGGNFIDSIQSIIPNYVYVAFTDQSVDDEWSVSFVSLKDKPTDLVDSIDYICFDGYVNCASPIPFGDEDFNIMNSVNIIRILYEEQAYTQPNKPSTFSMEDFAKFYVETKSNYDGLVTNGNLSESPDTILLGQLAFFRNGSITNDGVAWRKEYTISWLAEGEYNENTDEYESTVSSKITIKMSLTKSGLEKLDTYLTQLGS